MRLLNTELMAEPVNWITVPLMVLFGLVLLHIIAPEGPPAS
jgi:hypothetical protein